MDQSTLSLSATGSPSPELFESYAYSNLKISAYYQRIRLSRPTGAGKHIGNMTGRLSRALGGIQHIHASDDYSLAEQRGVPCVESPDSLRRLSLPRRAFEGAWLWADWPPIDLRVAHPDWIYCPAEYYVATRKSRLAVTIHCDNWFNEELPWYHDKDITETRRRRHKLYDVIAKKADLILCVSEFLRDRVINHFGVPEERTLVIGNGVEEAFFSPVGIPDRFISLLGGSPYACIVGGLTRRKGGAASLKIMADMAAARADFKFVVVGASESEFANAMSELPNVVQVGYLNISEGLPGLLSGAACLLFLSRYETFGIPAIEAMAAGTIPVVSNYGALPEIVGKLGLVLKESQYSDVPAVLMDLGSRRPSLSDQEALRARAHAFTWESCATRVLEALES
jgi:glycosyltransferase involved in cell wall biosynthesis